MRGNQKVCPEREASSGDRQVGSADGPASLAEQIVAVLPLIPKILIAVGVIQAQLDGVKKSHYTVEEIAGATGRAPYTIRTWIKEGRLKAIRVPGTGAKGRLLIPHEELARLVTSGKAGDVPAAVID